MDSSGNFRSAPLQRWPPARIVAAGIVLSGLVCREAVSDDLVPPSPGAGDVSDADSNQPPPTIRRPCRALPTSRPQNHRCRPQRRLRRHRRLGLHRRQRSRRRGLSTGWSRRSKRHRTVVFPREANRAVRGGPSVCRRQRRMGPSRSSCRLLQPCSPRTLPPGRNRRRGCRRRRHSTPCPRRRRREFRGPPRRFPCSRARRQN